MKKIIFLIGLILFLGIIIIFSQILGETVKEENSNITTDNSSTTRPLSVTQKNDKESIILTRILNSPSMLDELRIELGLSNEIYNSTKEVIIASVNEPYSTKSKISNILPQNQKDLFNFWMNEALIIEKVVYGEISIHGETIERSLIYTINLKPSISFLLAEIQKNNINLTKQQFSKVEQIIRTYKESMLVSRLKLFEVEDFPSSRKETQEKMVERRKTMRNQFITFKKNMLAQINDVLQEKQQVNFKAFEKMWDPNGGNYEWNKDLEYRWIEK